IQAASAKAKNKIISITVPKVKFAEPLIRLELPNIESTAPVALCSPINKPNPIRTSSTNKVTQPYHLTPFTSANGCFHEVTNHCHILAACALTASESKAGCCVFEVCCADFVC